jgi:hypothetical protein
MSDPPPNTPPSADKRVEFDIGVPSGWTADVSTRDLPISVVWPASATVDGGGAFSATATDAPFAFPPAWEPQKQELIRQHALLRQTIETARREIALAEELRRADTRIVGIGDNNPPEAIELPGAEEIVADALAGADAVLVENLASIRAGARLLRWTLSALEATRRWLADKGDRFANAFVDQAGKRSADAIFLKTLGGIAAIVATILGLIVGLFHMLGMPF